MNPIDTRILRFIKKHHVFVIASEEDHIPYTANCFYAYDVELNLFYFSSDESTKHAQQMLKNPTVAANIFLESKVVGRLQGLQLEGRVIKAEADLLNRARLQYTKKYPFTLLLSLELWAFSPLHLKFTDNTLGFGKKLIWEEKGN